MKIFKGSVAAAIAISLVSIGVAFAIAVRAVGKSLDNIKWDLDDEEDTPPESSLDLDPVDDFERNCRELLERWGDALDTKLLEFEADQP